MQHVSPFISLSGRSMSRLVSPVASPIFRFALVASLSLAVASGVIFVLLARQQPGKAGQQPGKKKEEEEDTVKPAKKTPVRVDDEPTGDSKKPTRGQALVNDLAVAARETKYPAVKKLFEEMAT